MHHSADHKDTCVDGSKYNTYQIGCSALFTADSSSKLFKTLTKLIYLDSGESASEMKLGATSTLLSDRTVLACRDFSVSQDTFC